jgi:hypothetical protein
VVKNNQRIDAEKLQKKKKPQRRKERKDKN